LRIDVFDLVWVDDQVRASKVRVTGVFRAYVLELREVNPEGTTEFRGLEEAAQRYGSGLQALHLDMAFKSAGKAGTVFDPASWRTLRDLTDLQTTAARRMAHDQRMAIERARASSPAHAHQALGLTHAQVGYVETYRQLLAEEGEENTVWDMMVERYVERALSVRAGLVANTEAQRGVHGVGLQTLHQMVDRGELDPNDVERTWHAKREARESHAPMNGQVRRGLLGTFMSAKGQELRYPGDARAVLQETMGCECLQSIRLR
jgi:hypothetical protein